MHSPASPWARRQMRSPATGAVTARTAKPFPVAKCFSGVESGSYRDAASTPIVESVEPDWTAERDLDYVYSR